MLKHVFFGAMIALSAPFLASAQCPGGGPPTSFLTGQTWAFRVSGAPANGRIAAIGRFTAFAGGYLAVTETLVDRTGATTNIINRLAPTSGRWMANDDCTGGMIQFMFNRAFFSFTFTVAPGGQQLTLSGRDENYPGALAPVQGSAVTGCKGPTGKVGDPPANPPSCSAVTGPAPFGPASDPAAISGIARLNPPSSCPVGAAFGTNPLALLAGTTYNYAMLGSGISETGTFQGLLPNPNAYSGQLFLPIRNIVSLTGATPAPPVIAQSSGRYIVYGDCSGGELLFNSNGWSRQIEFVFSRADFSEMFLLEDGDPSRIFAGTATRQ